MKKLALILALMIIPCSAFGLEMLNDSNMDGITGQSGVSIAVDDVQIFLNIDKMAYIDCDGYNSIGGYGTCSGAGGALVLNNFQIDVLNVNAIVSHSTTTSAAGLAYQNGTQTTSAAGYELYSLSCGNIPLFYDYGTGAVVNTCYLGSTAAGGMGKGLNNFRPNIIHNGATVTAGRWFEARAISIDVTDKLPALSQGKYENSINSGMGLALWGNAGPAITVGGVLIGIPTMEIYINSMSLTVAYDGDISGHPSTAINDDDDTHVPAALGFGNANFGTFELQGITFTTLSGWIEIAPH